MEKLTVKNATQYIKEHYGKPRQNMAHLVKACKQTAKNNRLDPIDIFFLLIENKPVPGAHTHSYGFHTAAGRHLIETTKNNYYNLNQEPNQ